MFNEYEFLKYCEKKFLDGLCQEDAYQEIANGQIPETIRAMPAWQLVCWLGEYLVEVKNDNSVPF